MSRSLWSNCLTSISPLSLRTRTVRLERRYTTSLDTLNKRRETPAMVSTTRTVPSFISSQSSSYTSTVIRSGVFCFMGTRTPGRPRSSRSSGRSSTVSASGPRRSLPSRCGAEIVRRLWWSKTSGNPSIWTRPTSTKQSWWWKGKVWCWSRNIKTQW